MGTLERWSDSETAYLIAQWQAGAAIADIAEHLNRSYTAVQAKVDWLRREKGVKLDLRHPGPRQQDGLARETLLCISGLWREKGYGPTYDEIGGRLNISRSAVVHRIGVLEGRGWIRRDEGVSRSITITAAGAAELLG